MPETPFVLTDEPVYAPAPMVTDETFAVLRDIVRERERQDRKWGEQSHDPEWWLAILLEEVGEAAQEVLGLRFGDAAKAHGDLRTELLHVAAVAVSALESLDFGAAGKGRVPENPTAFHTPIETCGRVGIGHGGDTWDPVCDLPAGHAGRCNFSGEPTHPEGSDA